MLNIRNSSELYNYILERDLQFKYMLLSRMKQDCKYFLGYGNRSEKCLWAENVSEQIKVMKMIHNSFPDDEKPEWLSMNDIETLEKVMTGEV